jgi:phage/plasmid-like protein (TIGR03299 family)
MTQEDSMSHEFESGVFTEGQVPWHKMGEVVADDVLNATVALEKSGLAGWGLAKTRLYVPDQVVWTPDESEGAPEGAGSWEPAAEAVYGNAHELAYAVRRLGTDKKVLGIVGPWYRIVHNEEAFEWMDYLVGEQGGFHYKTAGSLRGGQVVWLCAKAPFSVKLPDSEVDLYVLVTNPHDGSGCLTACVTPIRVVCMNTLVAAIDRAKATVKIRHTQGAEVQLAAAQKVLGLSEGAADRLEKKATELLDRKLSAAKYAKFLEEMVPLVPDAGKGAETRVNKHRDAITAIYEGTAGGQKAVHGTAWGALNALVAYHDHMVPGRKTSISTAEETRFERILGGVNDTDRAVKVLAEITAN